MIDCGKLPKVTTLVTFGISSPLGGSLLSRGCYFRGVVTFEEQKALYKVGTNELLYEVKKMEVRENSS